MFILGMSGFIIPYFYMILPVYETNTCWSWIYAHNYFEIPIELKCSYFLTNNIAFIVWSWTELMLFVYIYMKIESIRDELSIQSELKFIIIAWLTFSIIYFSANSLYKNNLSKYRALGWIIFITI